MNIGEWTKSVDDEHSVLVSVNWNSTYPIYEFVNDPIKKEKIKLAIIKYINSKAIEKLEIVPFYRYWGNGEHYYDLQYAPKLWYGQYKYEGIIGYVYPISD